VAAHFIGLTGSTIKDVEENKSAKLFSFRIESEWDGVFAFQTSSEDDFTKFMKQLKVAHEWCNKPAPRMCHSFPFFSSSFFRAYSHPFFSSSSSFFCFS